MWEFGNTDTLINMRVIITPDFTVKCTLFLFEQDYPKEAHSKIATMEHKI